METQELLFNDQQNMDALRQLTDKLTETETKLFKAAKEWRDTFDSIQDAIFITDINHNITRVNKAFAKCICKEPKECIGMKCWEICCGHTGLTCTPPDCLFDKAIETGSPISREVNCTRYNGWIEMTVHPLKNGHISGSIHIIKNIAQRKEIEIKLQQTVKTLTALCDYSVDYLWAKDKDNRFQYASKGHIENVLKTPLEEVIGKTDEEVAKARREKENAIHEFGEICLATDNVTKDTKERCHFIEIGITDGIEIYLDVYKTPILNNEGEVIGTVGCARNATPFKQHIEQELKELLAKGEAKHLFSRTYQILRKTDHDK